jgi:hypothetical protein
MHECNNCKKTYRQSHEDYAIIEAGKHIRIKCDCDPKYGMDILMGADPVEDDNGNPVFYIYSFDTLSKEGAKILAGEKPPIRNTENITVKEINAEAIRRMSLEQRMPPEASDCI